MRRKSASEFRISSTLFKYILLLVAAVVIEMVFDSK